MPKFVTMEQAPTPVQHTDDEITLVDIWSKLDEIKGKHGQFDFAFRSHSSANDRVCYEIEGSNETFDDPMHYTRAFKLFMDNVKPKYAIPFASNHCHLHRDVIHFNYLVNDPFRLEEDLTKMGDLMDSELKIMLPGDYWSSEIGFNINNNNNIYFTNKDEYIKEYADQNSEKLLAYYKLESRQRIRKRTIELFKKQLNSILRLLKRKLKNWNFLIILSNGENEFYLRVNPYLGLVFQIEDSDSYATEAKTKIFMPLIVFNSAVTQNMFHHSGISKRNKYVFANQRELHKWANLNKSLENVELQVYPIRKSYVINFIKSYFRRRRELLVYIKAFIYLKKGMKIYDVEEKILNNS